MDINNCLVVASLAVFVNVKSFFLNAFFNAEAVSFLDYDEHYITDCESKSGYCNCAKCLNTN